MSKMVGYDMTAAAATQVYEEAGIGPEDVDVVELHDCFTANELLTYEALGLSPEGDGREVHRRRRQHLRRHVVTNPSGGLLSKGHPLGATGLAQCTELVWQLRGQAEQRQVEGARLALQHNLGLGGACVVTLYREGRAMIDRRHIGHALPAFRCRSKRAGCASSRRRPATPTRSTSTKLRRATPAIPTCRCRRPSCSAWRWIARTRPRCASCSASTTAACCTASSTSAITRWPMPATGCASSRASPTSTTRRAARSSSCVRETRVTNQHGELVAELSCVTVVRNG